MIRCLAVLALLVGLVGCALAPDDTSLYRIAATIHHVDRPEVVGVAKLKASDAAYRADAAACSKQAEAESPDPSSLDPVRRLWPCLWSKGWRWASAPPSSF